MIHVSCKTENAARAKNLLKMSALLVERVTQKKRIEKLTRLHAGNVSARERSVADKGYTGDAVATKQKLTKTDLEVISVCR